MEFGREILHRAHTRSSSSPPDERDLVVPGGLIGAVGEDPPESVEDRAELRVVHADEQDQAGVSPTFSRPASCDAREVASVEGGKDSIPSRGQAEKPLVAGALQFALPIDGADVVTVGRKRSAYPRT